MLVVYLKKYWSSRTQTPFGCRGVLVLEARLSHSLIFNKENYSSNIVLSLFHVLWLMNVFDYIFDILFI